MPVDPRFGNGPDERRILANTTSRALAEALSKLISFAFYVVLAREVGDASFGVFTFAFVFVTVVTAFANFGQDAVLTREVARDPARIHHYFANTLALKIALALPALLLAILLASALGMEAETRLVVVLLGASVTVEALLATCFGSFLAFERMGSIALVIVWQRLFTTAVAVPLLLGGAGIVTAAGVYLAGAASAFLLACALFFVRVEQPRFRVEPSRWWGLMRAALPVGLGNIFSTTLFRVDTAILALFVATDVVGDYGAAYRLFEATLFLAWSVQSASYPSFARLEASTDSALRSVHERALKLAVAPTLPLAVGALVLAGPVMRLLYGEEYSDGETALALLAPAVALYPIAFVTTGMLIAQDRQNIVAAIQGSIAVENIAANLIFIPFFSLNAAALNTSVSELLLAGSLLFFAHRLTGKLDWRRVAAGPLLGAALAGVVMFFLRSEPTLAVPAGAAIYLVVLVAWERKRFPEDARAVTDFILRRA